MKDAKMIKELFEKEYNVEYGNPDYKSAYDEVLKEQIAELKRRSKKKPLMLDE